VYWAISHDPVAVEPGGLVLKNVAGRPLLLPLSAAEAIQLPPSAKRPQRRLGESEALAAALGASLAAGLLRLLSRFVRPGTIHGAVDKSDVPGRTLGLAQ
jgi:hypothetical protein